MPASTRLWEDERSVGSLSRWSDPTSYIPMFGKATAGWRRMRNEKSRLWNGWKALPRISTMKRGEAWWVKSGPSVGGEIRYHPRP